MMSGRKDGGFAMPSGTEQRYRLKRAWEQCSQTILTIFTVRIRTILVCKSILLIFDFVLVAFHQFHLL